MEATISAPRQVQMNTRIDEQLKQRGDEVLARLGHTPSSAVRGLWSFVVRHEDDSAAVRSVIDPDAPSGTDAVARKLASLQGVRSLHADTMRALGIREAAPTTADLPAWDDLRASWYDERLGSEA